MLHQCRHAYLLISNLIILPSSVRFLIQLGPKYLMLINLFNLYDNDFFQNNYIVPSGPISGRKSVRGSDALLKMPFFRKFFFLNLNQRCQKQLLTIGDSACICPSGLSKCPFVKQRCPFIEAKSPFRRTILIYFHFK